MEYLAFSENFVVQMTSLGLIEMCVYIEGLCTIGFLITAFVLGANTYAGFTAIFTGLVYCGYVVISYFGLENFKSRTFFGILLGAGVFLCILSLQTAVFWGEYSKCRPSTQLTVECKQREAMVSACVFACFMFIFLLAQMVLLYLYKDKLLGEGALDEGTGPKGTYSKVALSAQDTVTVNLHENIGDGPREAAPSVDL